MKLKNKILTCLLVLCLCICPAFLQGCQTSNANEKLEVTAASDTEFDYNASATLLDRDEALAEYHFLFTFDTSVDSKGNPNKIYYWYEEDENNKDKWIQYSNDKKYENAKEGEYITKYKALTKDPIDFSYKEAVRNGLSVDGFSLRTKTVDADGNPTSRFMTFRLFGVQCLDSDGKPLKFEYTVV